MAVRGTPASMSLSSRGANTDRLGDTIRLSFTEFLGNYVDTRHPSPTFEPLPWYVRELETMRAEERTTLQVDFEHVQDFNMQLADAIEAQYHAMEAYLITAARSVYQARVAGVSEDDVTLRDLSVAFINTPTVLKLRQMRTEQIGRLVSFSGTVTRTSDVRPELLEGKFRCLQCGTISESIQQQFKYTEPKICSNPACGNRTLWQLIMEQSRFADYQRIHVQENTGEIPSGSMPRSIDVIVRNEMVERAKAGDKCIFTGALIVVPEVGKLSAPGQRYQLIASEPSRSESLNATSDGVTGLRALGVREMSFKLCFLGCSVRTADSRGLASFELEDDISRMIDQLTDEEKQRIFDMQSDHANLYRRLTESVAPSICGHEDVKRGILLMLFGGVHKQTRDGTSLRGDINVCIVGDPSTAKSQFLKYVCSFLPRAVFASGKASSAAGLTASVVKDTETGEFGIEAGALMLADNGICCIDEFDKMDLKDQVAIHEAMEQQTISIAKAGIQATLNARTSILAAANPVYGRYDRRKSLRQNLGISPPIMSRFDLVFVIVDECDPSADFNIARHITTLHQHRDNAITPEFDTDTLRLYLRFARAIKPRISPAAHELLVSEFRKIRAEDGPSTSTLSTGGASVGRGMYDSGSNTASSQAYRVTVRQLESMIRLSEAIARLHCDDNVTPEHVREASRLLRRSIVHVESDPVSLFDEEDEEDGSSDNDSPSSDDDFPAPKSSSTHPRLPQSRVADDEGRPEEVADGEDGQENHDTSMQEEEQPIPPVSERSLRTGSRRTAVEESSSAPTSVPRSKIELSFEDYQKIAHILVQKMRKMEEDPEASSGIARGRLVAWYVEHVSNAQTEEDIDRAVRTANGVINKLIKRERVLLELPLSDSSGEVSLDDRLIAIHPNVPLD